VSAERARWLLLSYRMAREPSRLRLAMWRRLKRVGAVLLHGTIWTLPFDAKNQEHFEWLAEEIEDGGGRALLWVAESLGGAQDRATARRFRLEGENRYMGVVAAARSLLRTTRRGRSKTARAREARRRLAALQRALRVEARRDYFRAPGRRAAEDAVTAAAKRIEAAFHHALDHAPALTR